MVFSKDFFLLMGEHLPPPVAVEMSKIRLYISRNVCESLKKQKILQILNRQKLDFGIGGGTDYNPD